jgi:predicted enzyme related to lactoylglutathione lyase
MADASTLGRMLWYELLTTDMKAAERFYGAVLGWGTMPFEGAGQPYDMFTRAADAAFALHQRR